MLQLPGRSLRLLPLGTRHAARLAGVSLVTALGFFHLWLLLERLRSASFLEPFVALRWAGAAAVLGAGIYLRSRGGLRGNPRALLALAMAATMLHGPALVGAASAVPDGAVVLAAAGLTVVVFAVLGAVSRLSAPERTEAPPPLVMARVHVDSSRHTRGRAPPRRSLP